jgi:hypothetical protein
VYNEESECDLYSTERCEERKRATRDPGERKEDKVNKPWYVSWDGLVSRKDWILIARARYYYELNICNHDHRLTILNLLSLFFGVIIRRTGRSGLL